MTLSLRRVCAMLVVLLTLTPLLASAVESGKQRPVAWLALRSYQRLEQRLREITTMAKTPGLADMLLGMAQLQLAGLGGLDRQRPLGVVVPTVSLAEQPPVAVVLPYTERDAIVQTLRTFFPQSTVEDGERLNLQGGPIPAFGRLDTQTSVLIVATAPEVLKDFHVSLPPDLFGAPEGGPDLVLRVDVDAIKQRLDTAWKAVLASMEEFWQSALQKAAEDQALSPTDRAAMTAYMGITQKGLRQFLDDVFLGELRVTLAPTGWGLDLESRMRPGSASAAFLNAQAGHLSRVGQFFAPPDPGAFLRLVSNVRMTDALRQETTVFIPPLRQMFETRLKATPDLTPEQRTAGMQAIATYFSLLEQWYAQKELEAAAEMRLLETGFELTGWLPFSASSRALGTILDLVETIPSLTGEARARVSRNAIQHQGTALHRIELSASGSPALPETVFAAAQEPFLAFHLGAAPTPLQALLDRMRQATALAPTSTDALVHLELFLTSVLQLGLSTGQMGAQNPVGQALLEKLKQGPTAPFVMNVLTRQDAATVRALLPGVFVQSAAEVMGQQFTQQLRGGGAAPGSSGTDTRGKEGKSRP